MAKTKSRRLITTICIIVGILVVIYFITTGTGWLRFYHVPAVGVNKPTIKENDRVIASNLVSPKRFDFIAFYHIDSTGEEPKKQTYLFRLCGLPGDTVEIRKGDLYVNGIAADEKFAVQTSYSIPSTAIPAVEQMKTMSEYEVMPDADNDSTARVFLTREEAEKLATLKIQCKRIIAGIEEENMPMQQVFGQKWNQDNFGPIRVPDNNYFVLGDNRHASQDSRYIGFVPKKDYAGTILDR